MHDCRRMTVDRLILQCRDGARRAFTNQWGGTKTKMYDCNSIVFAFFRLEISPSCFVSHFGPIVGKECSAGRILF